MNLSKVVIITRAVSGSGKSTFANYISSLLERSVSCGAAENYEICCTDDYFSKSGEYKFDATKLGAAHSYCKSKFEEALKKEIGLVIVANTNTKESDFNFYLEKAKQYKYTIFSLVIENRHGGNNIHNVPLATIAKQEENIKNSLKLW
jgi:uridine kinase